MNGLLMKEGMTSWTRKLEELEESREITDPDIVRRTANDEQLHSMLNNEDVEGAMRRFAEVAWPDEVAATKRYVIAILRLTPLFAWLAGGTDDEWEAFAHELTEIRIKLATRVWRTLSSRLPSGGATDALGSTANPN